VADQDVARPGHSPNGEQDEPMSTTAGQTRQLRRGPLVWHHVLDPVSARLNKPALWEAMRYAGVVFICVRLGTFVLGLLAAGLLPPRAYVDVPDRQVPRDGGWDAIFTAWERQDALWYLRIADLGYRTDDLSAAFFPLFPALIRGAGAILHDQQLLLSGLIVSNCSFLAALVVIYLLTAQEFDTGTARRTTLYLAIFPYALFFMAPYSESLFLLLSALVLWALRRERWFVAGGLGFLAAFTRPSGVLLAAVVLLAGLLAFRCTRSWRSLAGSLGAALVIMLGLAAYLGYWQFRFDDGSRPLEVQKSWGRALRPPWETLAVAVKEATELPGTFDGGYPQLHLVLLLIALGAVLWLARHVPAIYTAFVVLALVLPLSWQSSWLAILSMPRFVSVLFPIFWPLARLAERYRLHDLIVAGFACGLGACTLLFVSSYYIY
jgi:Mannosyltransferase (PIG-V)